MFSNHAVKLLNIVCHQKSIECVWKMYRSVSSHATEHRGVDNKNQMIMFKWNMNEIKKFYNN